jgi:hypothetical protein
MRFAVAVVILLTCSCSDRTDDEIRAQVTLTLNHEGAQAQAAADRLAAYGRRAIPTIEAAMHTAQPPGKKNLIAALRKIGDAEAVPLLRQVAMHDPNVSVRREAEWTLRQWAAGTDARADKARQAIRALDEAKGSEEAG